MPDQQVEVKLDKLTFTLEDIVKIDDILSNLPYRTVKPIYSIIEQRMSEQGQAKLAEMQATKQVPTSTAVTEVQSVREEV